MYTQTKVEPFHGFSDETVETVVLPVPGAESTSRKRGVNEKAIVANLDAPR